MIFERTFVESIQHWELHRVGDEYDTLGDPA